VASIIVQLAPQATILPVRVLNGHGVGTLWTVLKGLAWSVEKEARVINLSLGTDVPQLALGVMTLIATCDNLFLERKLHLDHVGFDEDALRCSVDKQRQAPMVVAGEGNNRKRLPLFPAAFNLTGLVAVAASEPGGMLAEFSSRGAARELAAPGQFILGAHPGRRADGSPGRVAVMSGTSMAAPWVSATAALLFSAEVPPGADPWSAHLVIARMRATARPLCGDPSVLEVDPLAAVTNSPALSTCR
jgi:thermitase